MLDPFALKKKKKKTQQNNPSDCSILSVKSFEILFGAKSRFTLSIKLLEEDPMLGTLDKVIPQDGSADSDSLTASDNSTIELLPGLDMIFKELLQEDGFRRFNWEHPLIKKVSGRLYDEYSNEFLDSIFCCNTGGRFCSLFNANLNTMQVLFSKLKRLKPRLKRLNLKHYNNISGRVHLKRQQFQQLHLSNLSDPNSCNSIAEKIMLAELIVLEKADLQFYKQKANYQCTKLFHNTVAAKRKKNTIRMIIDAEGNKLEDFDAMLAEMIKFFSDLIGTADTSVRECSTSFIKGILNYTFPEQACH
ncbi:hypothetical protein GQ457_01G034350 [Hibiscus cannabinus]